MAPDALQMHGSLHMDDADDGRCKLLAIRNEMERATLLMGS